MSWPDALELLSAELGEPVTFRIAAEPEFLERLIRAGVPARTAENSCDAHSSSSPDRVGSRPDPTRDSLARWTNLSKAQ
jgi:hypothetical protein